MDRECPVAPVQNHTVDNSRHVNVHGVCAAIIARTKRTKLPAGGFVRTVSQAALTVQQSGQETCSSSPWLQLLVSPALPMLPWACVVVSRWWYRAWYLAAAG